MTDPLAALQKWYRDQCNGDWEHAYGVSVETLDNPGWMLHVDLEGTALEGTKVGYSVLRDDQPDWLHFWSDGQKFEAACGPLGLAGAIEQFIQFVTSSSGEHK